MHAGTNIREKRPWEFIWAVAAGTSGGKGPPNTTAPRAPQTYQAFTKKFIDTHMWPE